jgi:hypothetical protein
MSQNTVAVFNRWMCIVRLQNDSNINLRSWQDSQYYTKTVLHCRNSRLSLIFSVYNTWWLLNWLHYSLGCIGGRERALTQTLLQKKHVTPRSAVPLPKSLYHKNFLSTMPPKRLFTTVPEWSQSDGKPLLYLPQSQESTRWQGIVHAGDSCGGPVFP